MIARAFFVVALAATGCLEHEVRPCDDGTVCEIGQVCVASGGCAFEAFRDACNGADEAAACSAVDPLTEKTESGICMSGVCFVGACGDGMVTAPEVCDDGNTSGFDTCAANCMEVTTPMIVCGNGITEAGEECDDGNLVGGDGCQADCTLPTCGDGATDPGELCDNGALNSDEPDQSCRTDCTPQRCGDGVIDPSQLEICDDGNTIDGDTCSADCLTAG